MERIALSLEMLRRAWMRIGPYLLIEILLPGGTLLALLLLLYRRRSTGRPAFAFAAGASYRAPAMPRVARSER